MINLQALAPTVFLISGSAIPERAVTRPTESIFVTSSYVRVPPILAFPEMKRFLHF